MRWIRTNADPSLGHGDFVPRAWYGAYLAGVLAELVDDARAEHWRGRVTSLRPIHAGVHAVLADGRSVTASSAVLAVGCPPPDADWAPPALRRDGRLVTDPWAPGKLAEIAACADKSPREVLLVGAGLTMVDVALSIAARNPNARITAVSRTGLLPTTHRAVPSAAMPAPALPSGRIPLETAREIVAGSLALAVRETGDWRPGIDALRPLTQALWGALSVPDRARFLREDRRRWDVLRHRMAPQIGNAIAALRASGQLRLEALGSRDLSDYPWRDFDAVVACTGQGGSPSNDPLLAGMLADGSVTTDELDLGLDCDEHGHPVSRDGQVWSAVSVVGALRRGQLWESTAIPELRAQAHAAAARLGVRPRSRMLAS